MFRYTAVPEREALARTPTSAACVTLPRSDGAVDATPIGCWPGSLASASTSRSRPRVSLFLESNFGFIFPDDAVDGLDPGGTSGLAATATTSTSTSSASTVAASSSTSAASASAVDIESLQCPATLNVGETGSFMVMTNEDATQPVETMWMFGDWHVG